jgi:predicted RNA-binding Zn-ribbon protein involved in translation (DUF1610 family)
MGSALAASSPTTTKEAMETKMGTRMNATYDVVPAGERDLSDRVSGNIYRVIKTPQFGDPSEYEVTMSTLGNWCNCLGGQNHGKCKHFGMVLRYLEHHNKYACPRCGAVSFNPNDRRERYCGRCHQFDEHPQRK